MGKKEKETGGKGKEGKSTKEGKERRKEGRKDRRKEGRKERRTEGRKEGRSEKRGIEFGSILEKEETTKVFSSLPRRKTFFGP